MVGSFARRQLYLLTNKVERTARTPELRIVKYSTSDQHYLSSFLDISVIFALEQLCDVSIAWVKLMGLRGRSST